jgi:antitoxin (DNA-binding transcriptional repressor) of toxin-antitoxin stability system
MSTHTVAETKSQLSRLINRALKGEHIIVTRRGHPVIEFKPIQAERKQDDATPRWTVEEQLEWLRARRVGRKPPKTDAATLVRQMRDEDWLG